MDQIADLLAYLFTASIGYALFTGSQGMRALYIERMHSPIHRQLTKLAEYVSLLGAGYCGSGLVQYQAGIYYGLDIILIGLLARQFVKGDRIHRAEFTRIHQASKRRAVNRLIVNLGQSVYGQDN